VRHAFAEALCTLAERDDRVFLLTADLGYGVLEHFRDAFPDRFLNVGVAEQNMLGVATGIALEGYTPFVYSIASFVTTRCLEQIRLGPVLHGLPVRIVGTGAGFAYGAAGPTHYVHEDVVILRAQPGVEILQPLTTCQMHAAVSKTHSYHGPVYLRIGQDRLDLPEANEDTTCWQDVLTFGGGGRYGIYTWGSIAEEAAGAAACLDGQATTVAVQRLSAPCPKIPELPTKLRVEETPAGFSVFGDSIAEAAPGLHLQDPLRVSASPSEHRRYQLMNRERIVEVLTGGPRGTRCLPRESVE